MTPERLALRAAGTLLFTALLAPLVADELQLLLVPAALALFVGFGRLRGNAAAIYGVRAARAALLLLIGVAVAGLLLGWRVEPGWLTTITTAAGGLLLGSIAWTGLASAMARSLPRPSAVVLALALPIGLVIDLIPARLAPGVFFEGWGWMIAGSLFAAALLRLSSPVSLKA